MVKKPYTWSDGATLEPHSHCKHKILRQYFFEYMNVRCQLPQRERFRLAIVDGFAGGGRYACGTPGSPIIFVEELRHATGVVNIHRASQGMKPIEIECFLILNDESSDAFEQLQVNLEPLLGEIRATTPKLHLQVQYFNQSFETAYPKIKHLLERGGYRSVIFNLDQCGHKDVDRRTLSDIMRSYQSAEIFYTFAIKSLVSFLRKSDAGALAAQLDRIGLSQRELVSLEGEINRQDWLGAAERLVFDAFRDCARFVSPFSINNPKGWRYWLLHLANSYRARQVYNNVLHDNSTAQAHFGRSGLNMLSYDPTHVSGTLYLFDDADRDNAKAQLLEDIPRLVMDSGDAIGVRNFYEAIYNITPAHADDVHSAIIENPDLEVITPSGGARRKSTTIGVEDVIKLKTQKSFFPIFFDVPDMSS